MGLLNFVFLVQFCFVISNCTRNHVITYTLYTWCWDQQVSKKYRYEIWGVKTQVQVGLEVCYGNLEAFSDIFQNLIETQWVMWLIVNEVKKTSLLLIESVLIYTTKKFKSYFYSQLLFATFTHYFLFYIKKESSTEIKEAIF